MDDKKDCKIAACCKSHWCGVVGLVLVILAVVLTLVTFSGFGIFGMFLAGIVFCCHKHMSSKMCGSGCGCGCKCCGSSDNMVCGTTEKETVVEKKAAAKK